MFSILDWSGASLDIVTTCLFALSSMWAWPLAIISILINTTLYFKSALYADFSLQFVYLGLMLYGWYYWQHQKNQQQEKVRHVGKMESVYLILIFTAITLTIWGLLQYTNSNTATLDAITTGLSLLAQWLLNRRIIETWGIWFIVDAIYIGLYLIKGLPVHAFECLVYLGIAIFGFIRWQGKKAKFNQELLVQA